VLKIISSSIAIQLFLFICILLSLSILPISYFAIKSINDFGSYASSVNENKIKELTTAYLSRITFQQAGKHDAVFNKIAAASSMLACEAASVYNNKPMLGKEPFHLYELQPLKSNNIFFTAQSEPVVTAYWGGDALISEIKLEINALSYLDPIFIKTKELISESLAVHIITVSGIGRYYTTNPDAKKAVFQLPDPSVFDLRDGEPLTIFTKEKTKTDQTKWTKPYRDDVINGLMITASSPVFDSYGQFRGITGIDVPLDYIINEVLDSKSDTGNKKECILFNFLVDPDGKLVAFPYKYFDLFGLNIDLSGFSNSADVLNCSLSDSSSKAVRTAAERIVGISGNETIELIIDSNKYIMSVSNLETLGWKLVSVACEIDLVSSIRETQTALNASIYKIKKQGFIYAIIIFIIIILGVSKAVKMFVLPIKQLAEFSLDVADGNFQPAPVLKRSDEIGFLSRSFNRMVEKLQTTSEIENKYAETLRNQIRERTGELELKNIELVNARNELEKKVETRTLEFRKLNEYLINTEERERKKIANDLHDGVIQTLAISISKLKNLNDPDKGFDFAATGSSDELTAVQDTLTQAMKEIRLLTYQLSPPILYDFDLEIALGWLCEDLNVRYQMNVAYINKLNKKVVINEILKENLYKIVRELIINVLKHSGTTDAEIIISAQDNILVISVQDYGKGFDMNRVDKGSPWGFGLFGISERLKNFRGTIEINSKPAKGTIIVLKIPY